MLRVRLLAFLALSVVFLPTSSFVSSPLPRCTVRPRRSSDVISLRADAGEVKRQPGAQERFKRFAGPRRMAWARKQIAAHRGEHWIKPLQARAIFDLTRQLVNHDGHINYLLEPFVEPDIQWCRGLVRKATTRLVEEDVPGRLLRVIAAKLQQEDEAIGSSVLNSEGHVMEEGLRRFDWPGSPLAETLRLLDGVVATEKDKRPQTLERADGVGIMCLVAAALPAIYLDEDASFSSWIGQRLILPPGELDCAFQGSAPAVGWFELGTIGRVGEMPIAVEQLGQSLAALRWFFNTCRPANCAISEVTLPQTGIFYWMKDRPEEDGTGLDEFSYQLEVASGKVASETWGFHLWAREVR